MSEEEIRHISLVDKYGVKQVLYTGSNTMRINGKIYSVQMVRDVEILFKQAKGKTLTIYEGRMNYPGQTKGRNRINTIGGFITEE